MNPRAAHFGAEEVDLKHVTFTRELLASVPAAIARRYRVLPVSISEDRLVLALSDPPDLDAVDSVTHALQREVTVQVAEVRQLDEFIQRLYGEESSQ